MIFGHIDNQIVSQVQGCKWVSLIELGQLVLGSSSILMTSLINWQSLLGGTNNDDDKYIYRRNSQDSKWFFIFYLFFCHLVVHSPSFCYRHAWNLTWTMYVHLHLNVKTNRYSRFGISICFYWCANFGIWFCSKFRLLIYMFLRLEIFILSYINLMQFPFYFLVFVSGKHNSTTSGVSGMWGGFGWERCQAYWFPNSSGGFK